MTRSPTPKIGRAAPIQPIASPVSTYVQPPDPAPSSLHQLAQGLAAFDSGLKGWMQKKDAEQAKADAIRGEAAFNRNNQSGWAVGVASGAVPANASPVFMGSYKSAEGNFKGIKMREAFGQAYTMWEGRNSDDPEVFSQFLSDFISSNIDTDDADVLKGFNPHVELLTEQAYQTHQAERSKTVYSGHVNTRAALIGDTIDHASIQGVGSGEGTDYGLVLEDIIQQRTEALASGIRMEDFDKQLAATVASKAIEHGDPYLLDLLDQQLPGYDVKFSSLPAYRDLKATTVAALEVEARRQMNEQAQQQKKLDEEAEGKIVSTVFKHLSETPLIEVPEDVVSAWEVYDPEARKKLADARKSFLDGTMLEDPEDLLLIERRIQTGAGPMEILDMAASGVITDPSTFRVLLDRAQKRQEAGVDVLNSQTAKRFLGTIKERTTPADGLKGMFAPDGLTDEGIEATKDFESMVIDWIITHPDASIYERERFLYEAGELILKRVDRQDEADPQYISPADAALLQAGLADGVLDLAEEVTNPPPQAPGSPHGSAIVNNPAADLGRYVGADVTSPPTEDAATDQSDQSTSIPLVPPQQINSVADLVRLVMNAPTNTASSHLGRMVGEGVIVPQYEPETVQLYGQDAPPLFDDMEEVSRLALKHRAESQGYTFEQYNLELWKTVRESLGLSTEYMPTAAPAELPPIPPSNQSEANPDIFGFLEPTANPEVNPDVIKRFAGRTLPVSIRNNNMGAVSIVGDIGSSWAARQPGFIGTTKRPANEGGYYAKYATPEHGVAAASRLLERYGEQGVNTPLEIVTKWSADTTAHNSYASTLVKYLKDSGLNVGMGDVLDLSDPHVRLAILKAKSHHEAGAGAPVYSDAVFVRGVTYRVS